MVRRWRFSIEAVLPYRRVRHVHFVSSSDESFAAVLGQFLGERESLSSDSDGCRLDVGDRQ